MDGPLNWRIKNENKKHYWFFKRNIAHLHFPVQELKLNPGPLRHGDVPLAVVVGGVVARVVWGLDVSGGGGEGPAAAEGGAGDEEEEEEEEEVLHVMWSKLNCDSRKKVQYLFVSLITYLAVCCFLLWPVSEFDTKDNGESLFLSIKYFQGSRHGKTACCTWLKGTLKLIKEIGSGSRRLTGGKITINQSPKNFSGRYNDKKSRN